MDNKKNHDLEQINRLKELIAYGVGDESQITNLILQSETDSELSLGEVNPYGIDKLWTTAISPEKVGNFLSKIAPWLFKRDTSNAWIRVDELLQIQEDGSPKLVTLVRVSDSRPRYPVRSTISRIIENFKFGAARPVHIPIKVSR